MIDRVRAFNTYIRSGRWRKFKAATISKGRYCERCEIDQGLLVDQGLTVAWKSYERFEDENPDDVMVLCIKCFGQRDRNQPSKEDFNRSATEWSILDYLPDASRTKRNNSYVMRCPSCVAKGRDNTGNNLYVSVFEPSKYHCFAGCTTAMIRAVLGLSTTGSPARPAAARDDAANLGVIYSADLGIDNRATMRPTASPKEVTWQPPPKYEPILIE